MRIPCEACVALALLAIMLGAAAVIATLPGLAAGARDALDFAFSPTPRSARDVLHIATANARVLAVPLFAALIPARRLGRTLVDTVALAALIPSALTIGIALGAYGPRLLPWLPHLPIELAAMATAGGAYLRARSGTGTLGHVLLAGFAGLILVAAGAWTEVFLTPGA
jgi:hypothetical protein